jgi:hypothetical protein
VVLAAIAALAMALGHCALGVTAAWAAAGGSDQRVAKHCVSAEGSAAHAAGDGTAGNEGGSSDEGAPPRFTSAFYARTFTVDASLDGMDGKQLPISIEEICDVPKALVKQAVQLAGGDAVALLSTHTSVRLGVQSLRGDAAMTALDGADTAVLRVRLLPRSRWAEDEDGDKVATFAARRITITD